MCVVVHVCMCACEREQLRRVTQAARSWRGPAAAVETWMERSGLQASTESTGVITVSIKYINI